MSCLDAPPCLLVGISRLSLFFLCCLGFLFFFDFFPFVLFFLTFWLATQLGSPSSASRPDTRYTPTHTRGTLSQFFFFTPASLLIPFSVLMI